MEKIRSAREMIKIILDVENAGGLGVKTTKKRCKKGAKFTLKLMYEKFHQIQAKVQVDNRNFKKNQLGC